MCIRDMFQAVTDVITQKKVISSDIAAIGLTNQRETTILWDKGTGKDVYKRQALIRW